NGFRSYGPLSSGRYDPHPPPPADQPEHGIAYAADNLTTAIAEVFQTSRRVKPAAPGDLHATRGHRCGRCGCWT
ncbi:MAG: RES domain-containing protein, partial [Actinomycetota bacterium]|nr:RES domain-containing protein [Actinomycetota bacterium]